jgi:hypothetical protein
VVVVVNCRVGPLIIFGWPLVAVVFLCSLSIPVPYSVRDCVRMFNRHSREEGWVNKNVHIFQTIAQLTFRVSRVEFSDENEILVHGILISVT